MVKRIASALLSMSLLGVTPSCLADTTDVAAAQPETSGAELTIARAPEIAATSTPPASEVAPGKDSPGKRWRMLLVQNANYALTMAGMIVNVAYNFTYFRHRRCLINGERW